MRRTLAMATFLSALALAACSQTGAETGPYAANTGYPGYSTDVSGSSVPAYRSPVVPPSANYGDVSPWSSYGYDDGADQNTGPNTMYLND
jgi:hypothetical protein